MNLKIAIVGRPNVGKSTLFNRLVGRKIAIVDDMPGVTRDRREHIAKLHDLVFDIVDTAGLEEGSGQDLSARMREQTQIAINEADIILFVFDAIIGLTSLDEYFAAILRKSGKPLILVANKAESKKSDAGFNEAWSLGFGEPCAISAEHGLGMGDLRDRIADFIKDNIVAQKKPKESLRIAIVGRPNVGKSTFINSIIGEDRLLTGDEIGLTRDSISVDWKWHDKTIKLYDTAGLRKRGKVSHKVDKLSTAETLRAIRFAEIVIIMLDATIAFEKQDLHIIDLVIKEGRAPVVVFNKWDLIDNPQATIQALYEKAARLLPQIKGLRAVPVCALSTQTNKGKQSLDKLMENVIEIDDMWNKRISTAMLNRWLISATAQHPTPLIGSKRLKIKYATQVKARPPTFVLYTSTLCDEIPQSYIRYLTNSIRVNFDIWGVPIRIFTRSGKNPYAEKA